MHVLMSPLTFWGEGFAPALGENCRSLNTGSKYHSWSLSLHLLFLLTQDAGESFPVSRTHSLLRPHSHTTLQVHYTAVQNGHIQLNLLFFLFF